MRSVKPMKVLHVVGAMNRAGTEAMLMNIYRNINVKRIQFDFISYSSQEADYDEEIKRRGGTVINLTKTTSIKQVYQAIKQYGPYDAVHAHTLFHCGISILAALLAGVKVRVSHAHTTSDDSSSLIRRMYILLMRWVIITFSTNLLACSHGAGRYLFDNQSLVREKYSYFPNAIDYLTFMKTSKADINKFKIEAGLGKSIIVGHIGTFKEVKNHSFLIEVMKSITQKDPTIKLLLVGDGGLRKQIEEEAKRANLIENIKFLGKRDDISTVLHSINVFVLPSLYEGLGIVLLEAQACGIPCIVSEVIQPEANIDADLITQLSLSKGAHIWANKIIELAHKRENNTNKIIDRFEKSGYSLTKGITTLMDIYSGQTGGSYERHIDRQF